MLYTITVYGGSILCNILLQVMVGLPCVVYYYKLVLVYLVWYTIKGYVLPCVYAITGLVVPTLCGIPIAARTPHLISPL